MARRRLIMDIGPLKESPPFRRLWAGSVLSAVGAQMTSFAVALQVYTLTRSSIAVGMVGLASAVPSIVFGLAGGSVIDAFDRRRLVLVTSGGLALVSVAFAVQAFAEYDRLWPLYLLVALQSLLGALDGPARRTFLPRLLPAERIPAGAALTMFIFHASATAGPGLGGVVASAWGLKMCYLVDALSFAASLYGIVRLPAMPPEGGATRPGLSAVADGFRFIRGNRIIGGAFLADMSATFFGMPLALFPAINAEHFGGSAQTLGLLTAAPAVGGIIGSSLSGWVGQVSRQGRAMLIAGAIWGAGLTGFGLAGSLWLALSLLALAGAADVISVVFRTTVVQVATPDRYLGRVSAAEYVVGVGCPQLGNFRAGAVGSLTSPAAGIVSGGLATIAGAALIGLTIPALSRYRAHPAPDAADRPTPDTPGHPAPAAPDAPDAADRLAEDGSTRGSF
ncbi:MFS transporter [Sphaerisporangium corydalis]|uniref:MFS transporter n=1 Tax=Sphaerisporangium corydalis TaxID=1441875 RepID=A0ABV9ERM6_9ACTN|nr:MFS transporter [Sphaerisporangium corydalis]